MKSRLPLMLTVLLGLCLNAQVQATSQAKANSKKTTASVKSKKAGPKAKRPVQQLPSPASAELALGPETRLEAGCMDPEKMLQIDGRLQLQGLPWQGETSPQALESHACRHYAAVVTRPLVRNTLALLSPPMVVLASYPL